jgi:hypothetical protein
MVQIHFGPLGFRSFKLLRTHSSWSAFTQRIRSVDMYPSGDQRPRSILGLRRFLSLLDNKRPKCFHSVVVDLAPPVLLDDEQSLITSGLRDFGKFSLLCTQRVKARSLYLDHMTVDPLCSDPTTGIYFFLSALLGVWTWIQWSIFLPTVDLMDYVTPPPELSITSDLEGFVSVQRLRPLLLL